MATPVLIIGKSGSGKSASLRNCVGQDFNLVRVLNKPLPFKGVINGWKTDDYKLIKKALLSSKAKSLVVDDAGYLITNQFMNGHSNAGTGNGVFKLYNEIGDHFWGLIQFIVNDVPEEKIVYVMMHEDINDFGDIKPKTIGKLLDEKVCIEGMFTIVFRCISDSNKHLFITQSDNGAISKTPIGMFEELEIDNDLTIVDRVIREYYELDTANQEEKAEDK